MLLYVTPIRGGETKAHKTVTLMRHLFEIVDMRPAGRRSGKSATKQHLGGSAAKCNPSLADCSTRRRFGYLTRNGYPFRRVSP
jgi:hypothetical protein